MHFHKIRSLDFCDETPIFTIPYCPEKINLKIEESCPGLVYSFNTIQTRNKY